MQDSLGREDLGRRAAEARLCVWVRFKCPTDGHPIEYHQRNPRQDQYAKIVDLVSVRLARIKESF